MGSAHSSPGFGGSGGAEKCPVSPAARGTFSAVAAAAGAAAAAAPAASEPPPTCPMHKQGASAAVLSKVTAAAAATAAAAPAAAAPAARADSGPVYNVYSQVIDPANMMPPPNQAPAPGQSAPLPVERVKSTIPKGGTDGTWLYPSPQMFYNSLVRKNKADNVDVGDVNMVVAIHNEMNERTWKLLGEWEADHKG